jgi:hypothetical protein
MTDINQNIILKKDAAATTGSSGYILSNYFINGISLELVLLGISIILVLVVIIISILS